MQFFVSPFEYSLPNPRIDGFRKLKEVGGRTVEVFLTKPECFEYFKKNNDLPRGFKEELKTLVSEMLEKWPGYFLITRRAYVVPGLENPPGPRIIGASTAEEVYQNIQDLFKFAIDHNYNESKGSQIAAFVHPFVGPEKIDKNNLNESFISYGGYAVGLERSKMEIFSVFGMNEGVQSLVADRYLVEENGGRYFIVSKEVPQKNKMLCPTLNSQAEILDVPVDLEFEQILSDNEILEVARVVCELSKKYGNQRVEFSANRQGLFFNEVADYWKEEKKNGNENLQVKGQVRIINNLRDFRKLTEIPGDELMSGKYIVEVGKNIIKNRDYDVLGALASWKDNLYVLYPGVAATQHAMRVLTDKGHKAFLTGNQEFADGDEVQIVVSGGKVRATNLSRTQNQKYVSLWDASLLGVELCGGKADRLSRLKILGYQVPHGAVITTVLFDEIMTKLGYKNSFSPNDFPKIYSRLGESSEEIVSVVRSFLSDYEKSGKTYSVRSSATIEDASSDSMAGMFDTFLNVSGKDLSIKVVKVIRSAFGSQIVQHVQNSANLLTKLKMAVVIQRMVSARAAGVIFGAKVQTGNMDIVEIESSYGLGEKVVSGRVREVEQIKFSRSDKREIEHSGPKVISPTEAKALFMLSERLRSEFNSIPQDIEWAIDQDNQIWVLQSRDLFIKS